MLIGQLMLDQCCANDQTGIGPTPATCIVPMKHTALVMYWPNAYVLLGDRKTEYTQ